MRHRHRLAAVLVVLFCAAVCQSALARGMVSGKVVDRDGNPLEDIQIVISGEQEQLAAEAAATGTSEVRGGRVRAGSKVGVYESEERKGTERTYKAKTNRKGAYVAQIDNGVYRIAVDHETLAIDQIKLEIYKDREMTADWSGRMIPGQDIPPIEMENDVKITIDLVVADAATLAREHSEILLGTIAQALGQGDRAKADQAIEDLLSTTPNDPLGLTLRAYVHGQDGRYDEAESDLRLALEQDPELFDAEYQLAAIYRQTDRRDQALELFNAAAEHATSDEQQAKVWLSIGELERDAGHAEQAIESFERAVTAMPSLTPTVGPEIAALYTSRGETEKAQEWLDKGGAEADLDPNVLYNLAATHFNRKEWEAAREGFQRLIDVEPDFADAHRNLGYTLLNLGQPDEALAHFRRFLELAPDSEAAGEIQMLVDALSQRSP